MRSCTAKAVTLRSRSNITMAWDAVRAMAATKALAWPASPIAKRMAVTVQAHQVQSAHKMKNRRDPSDVPFFILSQLKSLHNGQQS